MPGIDVIIISPGSGKRIYQDLGAFELTAVEPPFWAALLGGFLRSHGFYVELLDLEAEDLTPEQAADRVLQARPRLAIITVSGTNPSASTMEMAGAGSITKAIKEKADDLKVMLHGLHPSALPERTLLEEGVDFVCQGEGFFTIPSLLMAMGSEAEDYSIQGLWYMDRGRVVSNPRPPVFTDLDRLPLPSWDLLPMDRYRAHNWHCFGHIDSRQPYGVLYTSLGCPYNCTFCCIHALFGKPGIRYRSPGKVLEDIDHLVTEHGIRNIKVMDELFAYKEDRVVRICDGIIERGYDLNMWAYARVNTVTQPMLERMKQAGFSWIAFGFESGSSGILEKANKRSTLKRAMEAVKMARDNGLNIVANFIFGLPGDDYDTMQETLELATRINAEWLNVYPAMAYPGSELHRRAQEDRIPLPEQWEDYSPYSYGCLPLPTEHLMPGEVLSFRDYAFSAYFENPRYLQRIHELFGYETVRHIKEMTRYRLKRKYSQFRESPA